MDEYTHECLAVLEGVLHLGWARQRWRWGGRGETSQNEIVLSRHSTCPREERLKEKVGLTRGGGRGGKGGGAGGQQRALGVSPALILPTSSNRPSGPSHSLTAALTPLPSLWPPCPLPPPGKLLPVCLTYRLP